CTNLVERLDVPAAKSCISMTAVCKPRLLASNPIPAPVIPPPITNRSYCLSRNDCSVSLLLILEKFPIFIRHLSISKKKKTVKYQWQYPHWCLTVLLFRPQLINLITVYHISYFFSFIIL